MKKEGMIRYLLLGSLLICAGVLALCRSEPTEPVLQPVSTAVSQQRDRRQSREDAYDKDVAALQTLADGGDAFASEQLQKMIRMHQSEIAIEEALRGSGFEEALVIAQGNAVTVMLPSEKITEENSARILALCMSYADVFAENVRIMDY